MLVHETVGVIVALIVLAGVTSVVINGGKSAQVLTAGWSGLANTLKVAEGR
jgi:hypothetical protein